MTESKAEVLNDQVGGHLIVNENHQLIEKKEIEGTPFTLVSTEDGHFISLGVYRLTEPKANKEEVLDQIDNSWNFLMNVIVTVIDGYQRMSNDNLIIKQ